jgi:hypothetical protein
VNESKTTAPADWCPDPTAVGGWRYWDGTTWTDDLATEYRAAAEHEAIDDALGGGTKPPRRRLRRSTKVFIVLAAVAGLAGLVVGLGQMQHAVQQWTDCRNEIATYGSKTSCLNGREPSSSSPAGAYLLGAVLDGIIGFVAWMALLVAGRAIYRWVRA